MPAASGGSVHGQPDPASPPPPAAPRIPLGRPAHARRSRRPCWRRWRWPACGSAAGGGRRCWRWPPPGWRWNGCSCAAAGWPAREVLPCRWWCSPAGALALPRPGTAGRWACSAAGFLLAWALGGRASLAAGMPYLGCAIVALAWLRGDGAAGRDNVLFLLLVVWASDIGAYAAGRLVGGPKLAPRISPGKTWSGAAGGLAAAMAVGAAAALALHGGHVRAHPARGRRHRRRGADRRPAGKRSEAALRREGFGPADPRPWRPARPARRPAHRRPGGGTAGGGRLGRGVECMAMKTVTVLGSTGSIGTQTVELLAADPQRYPRRRPGRRAQRRPAGRAGARAARPPRRHRRPRRPRGPGRGAGRQRHRGRLRRRGGGRGGRAGRRLDHGRHHRRGRPALDARRHPPRPIGGAGQQGGAGLRRRGHAARRARCTAPPCCRSIPSTTPSSSRWPTATAARSSRSC